mmetsp:Transcript_17783/g.19925  ORF Transcript_17783/g.19925 Transcript_17783/m.19925 type:complete len:118 (+) Transcript_17783:430-783(+)
MILHEPKNVFWCHKLNSAFQDCFPCDIKLPVETKSLLGLGLKICIEQGKPYQDVCSALKQFKRSTDTSPALLGHQTQFKNKHQFQYSILHVFTYKNLLFESEFYPYKSMPTLMTNVV